MDCGPLRQAASRMSWQFDLLPGAITMPHPAFGKFERFAGRPGLAMPFERERQTRKGKDREGRDEPVTL
jgi:hypothetical protein